MSSNGTEVSPYWQAMFRYYTYFYGFCYPIVTLVSLIGSVSLLTVMISRRKQIRYPETTSWAICWLLATDIGYLISRFIIYLGVTKILPRRLINLNEGVCWWWVITFGTLAVMQGNVQSIISIERLLAVRYPLKVKLWVTPRCIFAALAIATLYSMTISTGYVWIGYFYNETRQECILNTANGFEMAVYVFLGWTAPPCLVLTLCTIGIITKLVARSRSTLRTGQERQLSSAEFRLSLMLVVMDIVFVTTSLPLSVVYFALNASQFSTRMIFAWRVSLFLTSLGTYTDWIIVLVLGGQVRRAFHAACASCCCFCRSTTKKWTTHSSSGGTNSSSLPMECARRPTGLQVQNMSSTRYCE